MADAKVLSIGDAKCAESVRIEWYHRRKYRKGKYRISYRIHSLQKWKAAIK